MVRSVFGIHWPGLDARTLPRSTPSPTPSSAITPSDGALSRNLPASDARELGADFVICSDVSEPLDSAEELQSMVDVLARVRTRATSNLTPEQAESLMEMLRTVRDSLLAPAPEPVVAGS